MDISDFLVTCIKNNVFNSIVLRLMRLLGNDLNVRSIAFNRKILLCIPHVPFITFATILLTP